MADGGDHIEKTNIVSSADNYSVATNIVSGGIHWSVFVLLGVFVLALVCLAFAVPALGARHV